MVDNRISCIPRFEYNGPVYKASYLDYKDATKTVLYSLKQVDENTFDFLMKKYGESLLICIEDSGFDEVLINYFDKSNYYDLVKTTMQLSGTVVETPMILFKVAISPTSWKNIYYVNTRIIDRFGKVD